MYCLVFVDHGVDQELAVGCFIGVGETICVNLPGDSTFLRKMTPWPPS